MVRSPKSKRNSQLLFGVSSVLMPSQHQHALQGTDDIKRSEGHCKKLGRCQAVNNV
jgi:hypothetical protein